jgi:hypothetical protein
VSLWFIPSSFAIPQSASVAMIQGLFDGKVSLVKADRACCF